MADPDENDRGNTTNGSRKEERRTILRGAGVNFLGIGGKAIYPVFLFVALRLYSKANFGDYLLSVAIFEVIQRLVLGGATAGVQMFVARLSAENRPAGEIHRVVTGAFWMTLALMTLLFIPLFGAGGWAAANIWHKPQLAAVLWILACGIPPAAISAIAIGATKGLMVMRHDVVANSFLRPATLLGVSAALSPLNLGANGLAIAHSVSYGVAALFAVYAYAHHFDLWPTLSALIRPTFHRTFVKFAWAQNLNSTLTHLNAQLDIIMLGGFVGSAAVGFYGVGNRIAANLRQVKLSFGGIYSPLVAKYHAQGRTQDLERTYWMIARWILMAVLPIFILALTYREGLFRLFFGSLPYETTFFLLLMVGPLLSCSVGLTGNIVLMAGYSWVALLNGLAAFGINAALNYLLIPHWGLMGAAMATMSASLIVGIAQIIEVRVLLGVHTSVIALGKPLAAAVLSFAALFGLQHFAGPFALWVDVLMGLSAVGLFYLLTWLLGLDPEDRKGLESLKNKILRRKNPPETPA